MRHAPAPVQHPMPAVAPRPAAPAPAVTPRPVQPAPTAAPAMAPRPAPTAPAAAPRPAPAAQPAAPVAPPPAPITTPATPAAADLTGLVDVQADDLSYDGIRQLVIARGNVKVTRGADSVSADYAEVDTAAQQVHARGNIFIEFQGNTWRGDEATYNFRTGQGDFGAFEVFAPPYHVTARDSRRLSLNMMELEGVMLTTCDPEHPEYSVRASSASLQDNKILRAKHVRFQFGPVPFFWFPYVRANLEELAKFEFTPGWSSDNGPFLLTAYNQPINDTFKTRTHVDIRQKRGLGIGEDLLWKDPHQGDYAGQLRLYYANDRRPWHDEKQQKEREELIDENRYWVQLRDRHNVTDRDYLITELNYVSDPWLLNDFFDDEYQKNVQPENRVVLSHRGDHYTAGVLLNLRLNDFYENVDRLPEVFLNFNRQQILDTPLYYEGGNTLSYLSRVYPAGSPKERYDSFRFDTRHMLYWPGRYFGFLSLIPRAGYRGTFYSDSLATTVVTNVVPVTNELGQVIGTTNRGNPFSYPVKNLDGTYTEVDRSDELVRAFNMHEFDALISVGGDGSMSIANSLSQKGLRVVGVPKTIDNDLDETVVTFGFDTAVSFAVECLDRLHSTAASHRRILVVEVMGRYAGWIALESGIAGSADVVLIPEIPYDINLVVKKIIDREKAGRNFSMVVVAEGAIPKGGTVTVQSKEIGRAERLGGVGEKVTEALQELTGKEARLVVLGHLLRGGSPTANDRLIALRFGAAAVRALDEGQEGVMVALDPPTVKYVPLSDATRRMKSVPLDCDTMLTARDLGMCFGD